MHVARCRRGVAVASVSPRFMRLVPTNRRMNVAYCFVHHALFPGLVSSSRANATNASILCHFELAPPPSSTACLRSVCASLCANTNPTHTFISHLRVVLMQASTNGHTDSQQMHRLCARSRPGQNCACSAARDETRDASAVQVLR